MIRLLLPLPPFGAARVRARAIPVPGLPGKWMGSIYDDKRYTAWRDKAMPYFMAQRPGSPLEVPLQLSLVIVMRFRKGDIRKTMFVPRKWHTAKPDTDNIVKAVLDCAERASWMVNDSQVCRMVVEKVYAAQGESEGLHVTVKALDPYVAR